MNIQTVIKGMGGLLGKTVKASMEDFKVAMIIIRQKENMCTPSRKKIFQSISQNITNLKALSSKAPNPGPWRAHPEHLKQGRILEGQQQFPVLASIVGARLNHETLLEPEMRQEKKS